MIFSTNEREFLRIAATVSPDWSELARLCREAMDYGVLRKTALLHQLDGVIAWRLLDERLDGIVPNIVREDCQKYLDYLAGYNKHYWRQAKDLVAILENNKIDYATEGGPAVYYPLQCPAWPRAWKDIELFLNIESRSVFDVLMTETKAIGGESFHDDYWKITLPETVLEFNTNLSTGDRYIGWNLCEKSARLNVLGLDLKVPHAAQYVAYQAYNTWTAVIELSNRLSLWALARLANWVQMDEFSWDNCEAIVLDEYNRAQSISSDRFNPAKCAAWTLRLADDLYDIGLPESIRAIPEQEMQVIVRSPGNKIKPEEFADLHREVRIVEWDNFPALETFLFDHALTEGWTARESAGLWKSTPGKSHHIWTRPTKDDQWHIVKNNPNEGKRDA